MRAVFVLFILNMSMAWSGVSLARSNARSGTASAPGSEAGYTTGPGFEAVHTTGPGSEVVYGIGPGSQVVYMTGPDGGKLSVRCSGMH